MPRYFFHVHDSRTVLDRTGTELSGLDEARVEAVGFAGSLLKENPAAFWHGQVWSIDVADEVGTVLFTLTFAAQDKHPHPQGAE